MIKKNIVVSEIKSDIKAILNEQPEEQVLPESAQEKVFDLSMLRARLFKANYTAREINATLASFSKRGMMKACSAEENEMNYIFSKKIYE